MSDIADDADKRIEDAITNAVEAARRLANTPVEYSLECKWCGDPTEGGARYCCKDCASDAFRYESTLKRNGVAR